MFAVVDIETTGGNYKTGKIIEIAVALFDGKSVVDTFDSLVNPGCIIPSFITGLTGIDNSMIRNAPYFHHIAKKFITMTAGHVFVAHNVMFDYNFIKQEFRELGYNWRMPRICTLVESRKTFPELKSHGLGNLCRNLQIHNSHRHRAMGDALATTEILKLIMEKRQVGFQTHFSVRED